MKVCLYPGCRGERRATAFCEGHLLEVCLDYAPAGSEWLDLGGFMEWWGPVRAGLEEAKREEMGR